MNFKIFIILFYLKYFLAKTDIGKNRAECTQTHLAELNVYVPVNVHSEPLTLDYLKNFTVIDNLSLKFT